MTAIDHEFVTPELNLSDITTAVDVDSKRVQSIVIDTRASAVELFDCLAPPDQERLAEDIWRVGFTALASARADALSSSLEQQGETFLENLGMAFESAREAQVDAINESIGTWFDPDSGQVTNDLRKVIGPEGDLERMLSEAVGKGGLVDETINAICGPGSPIYSMLDPEARDSVVSAIEGRVAKAMDPLNSDGAGNRFLKEIRSSIENSEEDRDKQLRQLTSALDANDSNSAISRLLRDMNPAIEGSALHGMRSEILQVLSDFSDKQDEQNSQIISRLSAVEARFDTRKQERERAPVGGNDFESDAYEKCVDLLAPYPVSVTHVGNHSGSLGRCKEGDIVIEFDPDHSQAGGRVVIETKRQANWTEPKAIEALDTAMENRESQIGIFLMAESRAPAGFPRFKRVGSKIIATWEPEDASSNYRLEALLICALGLVRPVDETEGGGAEVVLELIGRLEKECSRSKDVEKWARTIVNNGEKILKASSVSRKKLTIAKENARSLLSTVGGEYDESEYEF